MRTLHVGLRVSDLDRSRAFYTAVGYAVVGTVERTAFGSLTMLRLPADNFVTIELVHDLARGKVDLGTGINHLVIQVESLDATLADLAAKGDRGRAARASRRRGRAADQLDHRPGRLPDRAGPVAGRPCRRHHRGRLRLSQRTRFTY
jgi:catechol 2,3-dioxygenase-like lactoylglutathione lyase family enzyme